MEKLKKGLTIFAFFFKIGCFTFGGGWAILAQMEQEFVNKRQVITKAELLERGLIGPGSAEKRRTLLQRLSLPEHLTPNAMLEALNLLLTREEWEKI
jgi:hypothetical protein